MKTSGIYIIKNSLNNKVYIGQSVNIEGRWLAHISSAINIKKQDSQVNLHKAMRELGIQNFYYEILEQCEYNQLNEKEIYYIKQYDSYINGYNMSEGGFNHIGENNPRAILSEEDVYNIRELYKMCVPFREVYNLYKNTISKRGLQKVWHYETWLNIHQDVYTEQNRKWHSTYAKSNENENAPNQESNRQRACSDNEISIMKKLREDGLSYNKIAETTGRSASVVRKYCLNQESTNPNGGITIQNIETKKIFTSYTEAGRWAHCDRHKISKNIQGLVATAGTIPDSNIRATWQII